MKGFGREVWHSPSCFISLDIPTVTQLEPTLSKTYLYLPWKWLEITWKLWEWDKAVVWEQLGPTYSPWLWWKWHSLWEPRRWLEGSQFVQESWTNYRDFWIPRSLWWKQINISQFPHKCEKENARRRIKTIKTGFFGWFEINFVLTTTRLKWSSVFYILLKASFDKKEKEINIIQACSIVFSWDMAIYLLTMIFFEIPNPLSPPMKS